MKTIEVKIELLDMDSPVYRVLKVPMNITFKTFHEIIQCAFNWQNMHLYSFRIERPNVDVVVDMDFFDNFIDSSVGNTGAKFTGELNHRDIFPKEVLSVFDTTLDEVINSGSDITYIYDFGDDWMHKIEIIKIREIDEEINCNILLEVKGINPPEDSGGPFGYKEIKDSIEKDASMKRWAKENGYTGKEPSISIINRKLQEILKSME